MSNSPVGRHRLIVVALAGFVAALPPVASAAELATPAAASATTAEPVALDAKLVAVESRIEAVTAYLGRAAVTRVVALDLAPGAYDLRFAGLPESIQPQTLQARASGPARVLGVDFETRQVAAASSPKLAELDAQIEKLRRGLEDVVEQHKINAAQGALIDQIGVRVADDATRNGGTEKLNIAALREQIDFMAEQRGKLAARREDLDAKKRDLEEQLRLVQAERSSLGGGSRSDRAAVVSAVVTAPSQVMIELTYLVANATWEPRYNIRAAADGSTATIEYNALLQQRTGEDWENVKLTLSTAQPMLAANPPLLQPWFVEVIEPSRAGLPGKRGRDVPPAAAMPPSASPAAGEAGRMEQDMNGFDQAALRIAVSDASVGAAGPSVTFQLPRLVTVKSNAEKQQTTRIAIIDTNPKFIYVAVPAVTRAVYIRGDITNSSDYQLLPGAAAIFVGQDYVGPTTLPAVAPKGEFKVHFGIDPAITATRQLITRKESKTGLFNGGLRTSYEYRLELDNGSGKPIIVELWDRVPISRTDRVKIEIADPSKPLATDVEYVEQRKPQGLLKWLLSVPANATGKAADVVTYGVRVDRAADVHHTPIPD